MINTNLCIDWGNTRVKAGMFQQDKLIRDYNFAPEDALRELERIVQDIRPDFTLLSSVVRPDPVLIDLLHGKTRLTLLGPDTPVPIINAYQSQGTLGMDRLALAVGAKELFPEKNNLIISLGTAITYNFLQSGGTFRGGNISPGLDIRFRSLHQFTDQLPLVNASGDVPLMGYDTLSAIRSGVIWGIAAEIDGMISYYAGQYSNLNVVLTGGNLPLFAGKIKNRIFADPTFLLKGLNSILNYNVR